MWANLERVAAMLGRPVVIPEAVVQQVLAASRDYPVSLWESAEAIASAQVRKRIQAVGRIAKKDHWFAD